MNFVETINLRFRCFVFFFKQKTAYEMRISDWSSDVCSSDLQVLGRARALGRARRDGLPLLPAGQRHSARGRDGQGVEQEDLRADPQGRRRRLEDAGRGARALPRCRGVRHHGAILQHDGDSETGRASRRDRVCQYVTISVVAAYIKNKTKVKQW